MNHETSTRTKAVEKYLLGELAVEERAAFEQHYFECPQCAEEVRVGFQFAENARALFREEARQTAPVAPRAPVAARTSGRSWFSWLRPGLLVPVAASLLVVAFSAYQNAVQIPAMRASIAGLSQPQALPTIVLAPASRGTAPTISVPRSARFFQLSLDIADPGGFDSYECDLRSVADRPIWNLAVRAVNPDAGLTLLVPADGVADGTYEAVLLGLRGRETAELNRYRFNLHRQ